MRFVYHTSLIKANALGSTKFQPPSSREASNLNTQISIRWMLSEYWMLVLGISNAPLPDGLSVFTYPP
jgi:hypothetical protein